MRQTASGGSSPIGTRGPGETQLETDRRHIRRKIQKLEEELAAVQGQKHTAPPPREKRRSRRCARRLHKRRKVNAFNCLTGLGHPKANDRLFDTLDTTTVPSAA